VCTLHKRLCERLYTYVATNYPKFTNKRKCCFEDGCFALIVNKNGNDDEKIIGIVPVNTSSIYSLNETFELAEFTENLTHFIHNNIIIKRKPLIVCDQLGGILCVDRPSNTHVLRGYLSNNSTNIINPTKQMLLDTFKSFHFIDLSDNYKIIELLLDILCTQN
jgi:hypothetical protein